MNIIEFAKKAELGRALTINSVEGERIFIEGADWHDELEKFAELAAAEKLEECAKWLDTFAFGFIPANTVARELREKAKK